MSLLYLFVCRTFLLFYSCEHFTHELLLHSQDLPLYLVPAFPFTFGKHPCLLLEFKVRVQSIFHIEIAAFSQKVKFPIPSHRGVRHLPWWSSK